MEPLIETQQWETNFDFLYQIGATRVQIKTFIRNLCALTAGKAKKEERERFIELLEEHRNEVLWSDENSNEVMRISIRAFINAVTSALITPTETLHNNK